MHRELKIFLDRLRAGEEEEISLSVAPDFLGIREEELIFDSPIEISGKAYLTKDSFIVHLKSKTCIKIPCSICNQMIIISLEAPDIFHSIFLEELKEAVFDYSFLIREDLLLQVPPFAECQKEGCPERKNLASYLKKTTSVKKNPAEETYFPFADL